ncbi:MAG: hypothetical protein ACXVBE_04810 [Bdellovibrionota bacterium]
MSAERTFLHDVSSPLTSVLLNLENVIAMLEDRKPEEIDECIKMLNSCLTQVKRSAEMVGARRAILMKADDK